MACSFSWVYDIDECSGCQGVISDGFAGGDFRFFTSLRFVQNDKGVVFGLSRGSFYIGGQDGEDVCAGCFDGN